MKKERENKIMEAACDYCHWPYVCTEEGSLMEYCKKCSIEKAVREERKTRDRELIKAQTELLKAQREKENSDKQIVMVADIFTEEIAKIPNEIIDTVTRRLFRHDEPCIRNTTEELP